MKRVLFQLVLAACCSTVAAPSLAQQAWRVCVPDLSAPPLLTADPAQPGLVERLLQDAGEAVGLRVQLLIYPARRCAALLQRGELDASIASPNEENRQLYSFPMTGTEVDVQRHLVRVQLVWVKRRDSGYGWDGQQLSGVDPAASAAGPLVGTRYGVGSLRLAVTRLGFPLDDRALSTPQLLAKLKAGRIELAVVLKHEFEPLAGLPEFASLVLLDKPLESRHFYAVLGPAPSAAQRLVAQRWWQEIARRREWPAYRHLGTMPPSGSAAQRGCCGCTCTW